jgi:hypothetical protein
MITSKHVNGIEKRKREREREREREKKKKERKNDVVVNEVFSCLFNKS